MLNPEAQHLDLALSLNKDFKLRTKPQDSNFEKYLSLLIAYSLQLASIIIFKTTLARLGVSIYTLLFFKNASKMIYLYLSNAKVFNAGEEPKALFILNGNNVHSILIVTSASLIFSGCIESLSFFGVGIIFQTQLLIVQLHQCSLLTLLQVFLLLILNWLLFLRFNFLLVIFYYTASLLSSKISDGIALEKYSKANDFTLAFSSCTICLISQLIRKQKHFGVELEAFVLSVVIFCFEYASEYTIRGNYEFRKDNLFKGAWIITFGLIAIAFILESNKPSVIEFGAIAVSVAVNMIIELRH